MIHSCLRLEREAQRRIKRISLFSRSGLRAGLLGCVFLCQHLGHGITEALPFCAQNITILLSIQLLEALNRGLTLFLIMQGIEAGLQR